ncbi:MAG: tRNA pseudouridine(38-40) synthase TruA [Chitinophagales bacterium]|nr:tRNA pseudouridine(38-40) synthase TruA [Chitinophagales bacterium]MCZ2392603.1 tRNA pseudouridine(38-40) synthase TruA [Chitinophagales bacterium]
MRYFLHLSYRGTNFHGWQRQDNAYTVQAELENKLTILLKSKTDVLGCGRTDTGVHAQSYFAQIDTNKILDKNFIYALNAILLDDISIRAIHPMVEDAHARFSALSRTYRYFIHYRKDPFLTDRSYFFRQPFKPDIDMMNNFCQQLLSVEDFSSFEKKGSDNNNSICNLFHANWTSTDEGCYLEICSNRFLRNMVRAIVGTSLMIGCKKREEKNIMVEVYNKERIDLSMTAPAHGLHLWSIEYPESLFVKL